jgi:hypothetical protein
MPTDPVPGAVTGAPRIWLRFEGLAVLGIALLLYARGEQSWFLFAILILVPDVSFAGYLAGPRVGAMAYNVAHTYVAPAALGALSLIQGWPPAIALIWAAHIGLDRTVGYGLKYPTAFRDTHLGAIGKAPVA